MNYFVRLFGQFVVSVFPALHVALILIVLFAIAGCSERSDNPGANGSLTEHKKGEPKLSLMIRK